MSTPQQHQQQQQQQQQQQHQQPTAREVGRTGPKYREPGVLTGPPPSSQSGPNLAHIPPPSYFQPGQNLLSQHPTDFSQLIPQPLPPPAPIVVVVANGQMDQLEVAVNQNGNDTKVTIN